MTDTFIKSADNSGQAEVQMKPVSQGYRRYALGILVLISVFNAVDKTVFMSVMEPVKNELSLNDTQLGLLAGLAFSLFYATLGLPFSRWADLGNRSNLLTLTVGLWSLMTALTGAATNFTQMFLARIGVGVGEGGGHPAALSMLSDLYPAKKGGVAIALFLVGGTIGGVVGLSGGAAIASEWGWRVALVALGIPGLLLALLIKFTLIEPRQHCRLPTVSETFGIEFKNAAKTLFQRKSFTHCLIGFSIFGLYGQGSGQWTLSYILRNFDISLDVAGGYLGLALGVSGVAGTLLGGVITNYIGARHVKGLLYFPIALLLLSVPVAISVYFVSSIVAVLVLLSIGAVLIGLLTPCIFAVVFGICGNAYKAMGMAILGMFATLIGGGLGPLVIGTLSDLFNQWVGEGALRYALIASIAFVPLSTYFFYRASTTLAEEFSGSEGQES